jgi:hypothetical protein
MADLMDGWEEDQEDDADGYGEPAPAVGGGMGDEDLEDDEGFDDDYDDEDDGYSRSKSWTRTSAARTAASS